MNGDFFKRTQHITICYYLLNRGSPGVPLGGPGFPGNAF